MSRLAEILASGRAPGVNTKAADPGSAVVAVPRAFRKLEETLSTREIEKGCGFKIKQIKKCWFDK